MDADDYGAKQALDADDDTKAVGAEHGNHSEQDLDGFRKIIWSLPLQDEVLDAVFDALRASWAK